MTVAWPTGQVSRPRRQLAYVWQTAAAASEQAGAAGKRLDGDAWLILLRLLNPRIGTSFTWEMQDYGVV
jgi:hypothetical protein